MTNISLSTEMVFDTLTWGNQSNLWEKSISMDFWELQWLLQRQKKKINPELNLLISFHDYCSQTENVIKTHTVLVHLPQNEH